MANYDTNFRKQLPHFEKSEPINSDQLEKGIFIKMFYLNLDLKILSNMLKQQKLMKKEWEEKPVKLNFHKTPQKSVKSKLGSSKRCAGSWKPSTKAKARNLNFRNYPNEDLSSVWSSYTKKKWKVCPECKFDFWRS